jgi:glutamyl-tRNA synthetase
MAPRVRFAPSPTGYLHIGGARTALYNYLYAKATGGTFVVRIEDTDLERSSKEYEQLQMQDLKWLGLEYDEGPDKPGSCGPYRQSERLDIYKKYAEQLVSEGKAYYCFCSDEELTRKKELAMAENRDPHYDGTCRDIPLEQAKERLANGEPAVIRFKVPKKAYRLNDHVRGEVNFPENMVGDFVIMRSNGMPVYNFCCVIDDWLMEISHVIRGEDHLNNTLRQLMIYEALGAKTPEFAHVSLLVGKDRQKLSKRHGATSVTMYREQSYLPNAMVNYLTLLGWSHPEEKELFDLAELKELFALDRFSKSPAVFDLEKFRFINGHHLRQMSDEEILGELEPLLQNSEFAKQSREWKLEFISLFKESVHFFSEYQTALSEIFSSKIEKDEALEEILSWETTPAIKEFLQKKLAAVKDFVTAEQFSTWQSEIKQELKIKGKPLFMGMRGVLTGKNHGRDLKRLIPLTPVAVLLERIENL